MVSLVINKYAALSDEDMYSKYGCVEYTATKIYLHFEIQSLQSSPLFLCCTIGKSKLSIRRVWDLGDYNELDFAKIDDIPAVLRQIYQDIPRILSEIQAKQPHLLGRTAELLAIVADDCNPAAP